MSEYQEFNLTKVGNNYGQYMLFGDNDGEQGDLIATFHDLHYAELAVAFLNQMLEEDKCLQCTHFDGDRCTHGSGTCEFEKYEEDNPSWA